MASHNKVFKFPVSVLVGSNISNIFRVINGYRIDLRYFHKLILTIIISSIFELLNLYERLICKKRIKSLKMDYPPVFVIGFWRSGTTLLHSMLCQDPHSGYLTTFQGVFPNLVLTQNRWMKALLNLGLPRERPFDAYPMDMDFPQEEEFAMMSLYHRSIYRMFYFPKDFKDIYENDLHFERLPDEQRKRWEIKYMELINKAMINTGGKRYVSKNPCNIFRIKTLINHFPDAKFIFIYRNPYTVVESLCRFVNEVLPGSELQHLEGGIQREQIARLYKDSLDEYMTARENIKPASLFEISYEEFKKQPVEILRGIYNQFNIEGFEEAKPRMQSYLENNHPNTRSTYLILPETYQLVNKYASDIVTGLGYEMVEPPQ
ncbi:MAG: sulfotransferase [Bacteroidia bacterium]|nr:MAG: sulfotransferase [Bacteroidia bacterium]